MRSIILILLILVTGMSLEARAAAPSLDWMAGQWCSSRGTSSIEETWLPAKGGLMLGMNRTSSPKRTGFEFLRIEITGESAEFVAQPGGAPPTRFGMIASGEQSVTFANPEHDYPKRIGYRRDGEALVATTDAGSDGDRAMTFRWTRCP